MRSLRKSLLVLHLVVCGCASLIPPITSTKSPISTCPAAGRHFTPQKHEHFQHKKYAHGDTETGLTLNRLNGGGMGIKNRAAARAMMELGILVFFWYSTSLYYTNTTKSLSMHWGVMALVQVIIASICSIITIPLFKLTPDRRIRPFPTRDALGTSGALALTFGAGFMFLNAALCMMRVSLVMVLRTLEPLGTAVLSMTLLGETTSLRAGAALVSICMGAALSAIDSTDFTAMGLLVTFFANISFSLCAIFAKKLKREHKLDDFNIFLQCSTLSAPIFLAMLVVFHWMNVDLMLTAAVDGLKSGVLIFNGISFFVYNQFAWIVLGRVSTVSYSVLAALRKTFVCVCGSFGNPVSALSAFGITLASVGSLFYADAKRAEASSCTPTTTDRNQ